MTQPQTTPTDPHNWFQPGEIYKLERFARDLYREPYDFTTLSTGIRAGNIPPNHDFMVVEWSFISGVWWMRVMLPETLVTGWLAVYDIVAMANAAIKQP